MDKNEAKRKAKRITNMLDEVYDRMIDEMEEEDVYGMTSEEIMSVCFELSKQVIKEYENGYWKGNSSKDSERFKVIVGGLNDEQ